MRNSILNILAFGLFISITSCDNKQAETSESKEVLSLRDQLPIISHVMTLEDQQRLTPDMVLAEFKEGN